MKAKRYFVGAAAFLALLINFPQASAEDEVVTFGDEFEEIDEPADESEPEIIPFRNTAPVEEEEDFGELLIFDDLTPSDAAIPADNEPVIVIPPDDSFDEIITPPTRGDEFIDMPADNEEIIYEPSDRILPPSRIKIDKPTAEDSEPAAVKQKTQKARFVKLAIDDNYTYYLDRQSVSWTRIPYSASEYMVDVWIRMIELAPDNSDLPPDLYEYINDTTSGEVEVAHERGINYAPIDVDVLQHKKYFLEHYYLRPKTRQIQFLCELEVVGHPQNTITERQYDYKNWENLIPSSIESIIYNAVMKEVGRSGSADSGKMSLADNIEEYLRISIR